MEIDRTERLKVLDFDKLTGKCTLGVSKLSCYICGRECVPVAETFFKHKYIAKKWYSTVVCVRCLKNKLKLNVEKPRKEIQRLKNRRDLAELFSLTEEFPEVAAVHPNVAVFLGAHESGRSVPPQLVGECYRVMRIYSSDRELREGLVWVQSHAGNDSVGIFEGRGGVWPTLDQRRQLASAMHALQDKKQ